MSNHFASIPTRTARKIDLTVYETNGEVRLSVVGSDRRCLEILDLDEVNFNHYWRAIGKVVSGEITPHNKATYPECPPE